MYLLQQIPFNENQKIKIKINPQNPISSVFYPIFSVIYHLSANWNSVNSNSPLTRTNFTFPLLKFTPITWILFQNAGERVVSLAAVFWAVKRLRGRLVKGNWSKLLYTRGTHQNESRPLSLVIVPTPFLTPMASKCLNILLVIDVSKSLIFIAERLCIVWRRP